MKIDRSIDTINDCEPWRKFYQTRYGFVNNMMSSANKNTGIIFTPYVFSVVDLYPNKIEPFNLNTNEIKTKIRYRTFKRYRAGR